VACDFINEAPPIIYRFTDSVKVNICAGRFAPELEGRLINRCNVVFFAIYSCLFYMWSEDFRVRKETDINCFYVRMTLRNLLQLI